MLTLINIVTWMVVFLPVTAFVALKLAIAVARRTGRMPAILARVAAILEG